MTSIPALPSHDAAASSAIPARRRRRTVAAAALAGVVGSAVVGLSLAVAQPAPQPQTVQPVAISALAPAYAVAAKGEVAEIFGNKFILQDGSGRALVETGREGESGRLVARGDTVTVQGRFENGFLHAQTITRADGSTTALGPMGMGPAGGPPPRPGPMDWARDRIGLGPTFDVQAMTAIAERAGYRDVRLVGRGPKHGEFIARGPDGSERLIHVHMDGEIRDRMMR